jgi:hypothetical protein
MAYRVPVARPFGRAANRRRVSGEIADEDAYKEQPLALYWFLRRRSSTTEYSGSPDRALTQARRLP